MEHEVYLTANLKKNKKQKNIPTRPYTWVLETNLVDTQ